MSSTHPTWRADRTSAHHKLGLGRKTCICFVYVGHILFWNHSSLNFIHQELLEGYSLSDHWTKKESEKKFTFSGIAWPCDGDLFVLMAAPIFSICLSCIVCPSHPRTRLYQATIMESIGIFSIIKTEKLVSVPVGTLKAVKMEQKTLLYFPTWDNDCGHQA